MPKILKAGLLWPKIPNRSGLASSNLKKEGCYPLVCLGFGTSFVKNNRFFSIGFSKITGYSDYYFSK